MSYNEKKSSSTSLLLILGILAFMGLSGYLWYTNNNLKTELNAKNSQFSELQGVHNELDTQYQAALESIESLRDDSKELNELINSQKAELADQKKKINNLIWNKNELGKARDEIATFQGLTAGYLNEINGLKSQIATLQTNNVKLTEEKDVLMVNLDEQKIKTAEVEEAKEQLVKNVSKKESEILDLANTVDIASAIKINWLQVTGHQMKDDGTLKSKKKAKDIDVLRICYKTETNVTAPAGEETFNVRFIDPQGQTIAIAENGSGVLTNKLTDQQVKYTTSSSLDYQNTDAENCVDWQSDYPFVKGVYGVEIYNKDYLTGKGDFKLK